MNRNEPQKEGLLIVLSGPSGVGKGTVISKLFEMDENLYFSVSATTRKPRPGETDGVSYNFKTREQFEEEIDNGEMLEYAMYGGNYYGTPKSAVEKKLAQGKDVVLDIEINGARSVSRLMPEAVLVYILPPDMAELRRRLEGRRRCRNGRACQGRARRCCRGRADRLRRRRRRVYMERAWLRLARQDRRKSCKVISLYT